MATLAAGHQILRYPKTRVEDYDDYLEIQILQYKPPGLGLVKGSSGFQVKSSDDPNSGLSEKNKVIKSTIILPIPKDLSPDTKSVEWGEDRMNSVAAAAAGGAADIIKSGSVGDIFDKIIKGGEKLAGAVNGNTQQAVASGFAIAAVNQLTNQGYDPFAAITRNQGAVVNQNQELLFKGVTLRDFAFNFTMTPRFREEAEEIRSIIRYFKQSSSAYKNVQAGAGSQGLFIASPDVYQLTYKSGKKDHPYLNQFKVCALLSMTVNYGAAGVYATYADGSPIQTNMTLSFRELTPVYYEDYTNGKGEIGTGY